MSTQDVPYKARMAIVISRYATPLAILLVVLGISATSLKPLVRDLSCLLLIFGLLFNLVGWAALEKFLINVNRFVQLRLWVNLVMNAALVYLLGAEWPPIWLLLVLTPFAMAIYDSRRRTALWAGGVSVIFLVIQALSRGSGRMPATHQAACVAFILLVSLMINEVSKLSRTSQERPHA